MARMWIILGLLGTCTVGASAATFIVDKFTDTSATWPLSTTTIQVLHNEESGLPTANTIGGRRETRVNVTAVQGSSSESFSVFGGVYSHTTTNLGQATSELSYGCYRNGTSSPWTVYIDNTRDLNANWTGESGILMVIPTADLNGSVVAKINAGGTEYTNGVFNIPQGASSFTMPFSAFTTPTPLTAALGDIDGATFQFTGPIAWDVSLDLVGSYREENIPEPMTMALVSLGVAGLGGYIRRRR